MIDCVRYIHYIRSEENHHLPAIVYDETDGEYYLTFKRFDPATGKEVEAERQMINLEEMEGWLQRHQDAVDGILAVKQVVKEMSEASSIEPEIPVP